MGRVIGQVEIEIDEGGALVLRENGDIDYLDEAGNRENSWGLDDPEWGNQARHFNVTREDFGFTMFDPTTLLEDYFRWESHDEDLLAIAKDKVDDLVAVGIDVSWRDVDLDIVADAVEIPFALTLEQARQLGYSAEELASLLAQHEFADDAEHDDAIDQACNLGWGRDELEKAIAQWGNLGKD